MTDLPPPGWYDDPTSPVNERWWDGERWSEQTRRKATTEYEPRAGELRQVGDYLGHAFGMIRKRWDDFLLVTVIGSVLLATISIALVRPVIDALDFSIDEIRGFGSTQAAQLIAFFVLFMIVAVGLSMAHYRIAWSAAIDESVGWATALQYGIASTPRLVGWVIVAILPIIIGTFIFVLIANAVGGLGALIGIALFVAVAWWAIVVTFVPISLVIQPRGTNPIRSSIDIVKGKWWRIFGRLLVMGLIAGLVVNAVTAIMGQAVGSSVFGIELIVDEQGDIEIVKNLGNGLEFFLGALVFIFMSFVGNVATFCGVTSIAYDAMPGAAAQSADSDPNQEWM